MTKLWLGLLFLAVSSVAHGQVHPQFQETRFSRHPLTVREGRVIVKAVWKRDLRGSRKPDCSHLVHEVYTRAGYPYPYASSVDLYVGIKSFVQVTKPQPGDLVVWRGHVGIVIDPVEHSFYSSVSSGLRTEFYDAGNWKALGVAKFYRYLTVKSANPVLTGNRPARSRGNTTSMTNTRTANEHNENVPNSTHSATKTAESLSSATTGNESSSSSATVEIRDEPSN